MFLLIIFLGTDGEAEFLWCRREETDGVIGVGVGTTDTFGLCRALEQFAAVGPALEDLVGSSPLLLFPVSISHTINTVFRTVPESSDYLGVAAAYSVKHATTAAKGILMFCFIFPRAFATPLLPHHHHVPSLRFTLRVEPAHQEDDGEWTWTRLLYLQTGTRRNRNRIIIIIITTTVNPPFHHSHKQKRYIGIKLTRYFID